MDKEIVKQLAGITTSKHDAYIDVAIPLFLEFIQEHCNNDFTNDLGVVTVKGGIKIAIAKMIEFNMNKVGQKTRTFGDVAYSFDTDFPPSIMRLLQPYNRIRV
ncbi:phage head-tail connector protein [Peribacillus simplex]|uniref:Phage head-tail connector protein n=2 Tax=Peribacillus TaxID=2675229 RepID=A0AA90T702_9BACI|nr:MULTISPECIES: phage head-tail connector protein [Peribacillus]MDP1419235.1 phage head-tail connector protein [Peribacillus simplex]MDP1452127.1 phage head-tail connector protein [Peribacillus frigoritolerans]